MGEWRQWIPVQLVPSSTPGKMDKIPVSPADLTACNAHDSNNWRSFDEIAALLQILGSNYMPGFVLTPNDPYYLLDPDNCVTVDGQWTPVAVDLMQTLTGAAIELSQSGRGLHIIGRWDNPIVHSCRNKEHNLELYHQDRFIAMSLNALAGDCETNTTTAMNHVAATYFPPRVETESDWREGPVPEWSGPTDDEELIRKLLGARSLAVFGGKATAADCWNGTVERLAYSYPTQNAVDPYDRSLADYALAGHLNWWTGNDHPRVERLMRRSALVRDKWDSHRGYLRGTIQRATSDRVMGERLPQAPESGPDPQTEPSEPGGQVNVGDQFVRADQLGQYFDGCVYVADVNRVFTPAGELFKPESFKGLYGGAQFALDTLGQRVTDDAFKAFTQSQAVSFPKVVGSTFRPLLPPGQIIEEEDRKLINTYIPIRVPRVSGDPSPFINHLKTLYPQEWHVILAYMIAVIRNPGRKFQWWPVLQGAEGNGKTFIFEVMYHAVGLRYSHTINAKDMDNKFTGWLPRKLFVTIEDLRIAGRWDLLDALKTLITNIHIEVQGKGADQYMCDNAANGMVSTNFKDAVPITDDTRRLALFFSAQQTVDDIERDFPPGYFQWLYNWAMNENGFAITTDYLMEETPDARYDPAGDCIRAPKTSATAEAVELSRGTMEQEVLDAIEVDRPGFAGGWMSSHALDTLLSRNPAWQKMSHTRRRQMVQSLGYDWHPSLQHGRASRTLLVENCKPKLYIRRDHIHRGLTDPSTVTDYYERQQGYRNVTVQTG